MAFVPVTGLEVELPECDDETARAEAARAHQRIDSLPTVATATPYDDSALKAELDAVKARLAAEEAKPDDDLDDVARQRIDEDRARIAALEAKPTGGTATVVGSNKTPFNSLGADDTQRFTNLAAKMRAGWTGEVEFEFRNHNCPVQIPTAPGRWVGGSSRAFEYGKNPTITYTGPSGTSMFVLYKNTGYSYPANGVSRDFVASGIQFNAGNDKDFLPPAPGGFDGNYVQWYWDFPDCGFVGWRNIAKGWGTGLDFSGFVNVQGNSTTPFIVGGSECKWGLKGGFMDSGNATWTAADLPFIECSMSKSVIGSIMISARLKSYQLKVTYGHGTRCIGTEFDAPDSMPTTSYQVRFIGSATTFNLDSCSFKGGQGIQAQNGATEIGVSGCTFHGNRGLARLEAAFTGVLKWDASNTYGTCPRVIYAARADQVICMDPTVTVKALDGVTVLKAATR